jgi:dienelactone hydrolase
VEAVVFLACTFVATAAESQDGVTLDAAASSPGANYEKAEFRLWYPDAAPPLRAVVALVPGSNGDGRSLVDDGMWRTFAARHHLALLGCRFVDKPHDESFIEQYVDASRGSGQALLDGLALLAGRANRPELAAAPLLLWGFSAGGEFNYEFVAWKPERVAAFIVNKGGVYYSALLSRAARNVPGMFFVGAKDSEFRTNIVVGLFALNRRGGALWALVEEPGVAHFEGRSREMAAAFFEEVIPLRLPVDDRERSALRPMSESAGFLGDLKTKTYQLQGSTIPAYPMAWLPTERAALAWKAVATQQALPR